jgi:uncharacterized membrane protein
MAVRARLVLAGLASLAYLAGSHWLMVAAADAPWSAFALLAPMLGALGIVAARTRQWWLAGLVLAALAALGWHALVAGGVGQQALFLGQHVIIHLGLAVLFGVSLRRGSLALIGRVALRVHGTLTPAMTQYTRQVTAAWTIYFIAMAVSSAVIFAFASLATWATFANWGTPLALGAMFGGEHLLRYRLHPEFERVSMWRAIQAYSQGATRGVAP